MVDRVALARLELPADPASVGEARRFVLRLIDGTVDDDVVDAALVITSELATNAVLHAQTSFGIAVLRDGEALRIEVRDGSDRLPRRKRYSDHSATGRGLLLVDRLATVAGAELTGDGKVVWAVIGDPPAESLRTGLAIDDAVPAEVAFPGTTAASSVVTLDEDERQVATVDSPDLPDRARPWALVDA